MWNVKYNLVKKHNFDLIYKINTNLTFSQITDTCIPSGSKS